MRHAGADSLDRLEPLLAELRGITTLREKTRGTFYLRSKAFVHFHEDGDDLYADVRLTGPHFDRVRVTTASEQSALLRRIRATI